MECKVNLIGKTELYEWSDEIVELLVEMFAEKNRLVFCALCFAVLQGRLSVLRFERLDEKGEGVVAAFFANREYGVVGVAQKFGGVIDA